MPHIFRHEIFTLKNNFEGQISFARFTKSPCETVILRINSVFINSFVYASG